MRRKTLQELTIMDGFLFGAVMMDPENCRLLLERILEIPIARVEVVREKSMIHYPGYKGVRLDVYAKDEKETRCLECPNRAQTISPMKDVAVAKSEK